MMTRKLVLRILLTAAIAALPVGLFAQGKGGGNKGGGNGDSGGKCDNIPLRITLLRLTDGNTSVLSGDGSSTYQDGVDRVKANIQLCSGSRDATIVTSRSSRTIGMAFPAPVPGSSLSGQVPSWVDSDIDVSFFFNIRNLLCHEGDCGDTFTTRMNWQFTGPDGEYYHLRFYPFLADAPDLHSPEMLNNEPDINEPDETSPVVVYHRPGNCGDPAGNPVVFDQWDIIAANPSSTAPELIQLGTLHRFPSKPNDEKLHMGQYAMPYRLQIEALRCF